MKYDLLGQDLHETADRLKVWFAEQYGASHFRREERVEDNLDLPLKPTWQARLDNGYRLCLNVQSTPFSQSLAEFVNSAAINALPIKLWVGIGQSTAKATLNVELKRAKEAGVGVVQILENGEPYVVHHALALSLFGLPRMDLRRVAMKHRERFRHSEDTFLSGGPAQACQDVCQELESVTRLFAEETYRLGWWKSPHGAPVLKPRFFKIDPWAKMLEALEQRIDQKAVEKKCPGFNRHLITQARSFTDWRNQLSHKPATPAQTKARDARLRPMFEVTRQLLVDWLTIAKPLKLG